MYHAHPIPAPGSETTNPRLTSIRNHRPLRTRFVKKILAPFFGLLPFLLPAYGQPRGAKALSAAQITAFARQLDSLRTELRIPGLAAALFRGDSLVWAEGFGYGNLEAREKTTPQTTFRIASLTKTLTSTLVMQLVEAGKLDLDAPISRFGLDLGHPGIAVKHLLTHTAQGEPGTHFQYNGYLFGRLGPVVEKAAGQPFYQLLFEQILLPLRMTSTAPDVPLYDYFTYGNARPEAAAHFTQAFSRLARPYALTDSGAVAPGRYNNEFGAFGGLVSSVGDVGKYALAVDRHQFVSAATQERIFTPNRTKNGEPTPYGLGWFTQTYQGTSWVWHFGQASCESALLVKVPARRLTLVVLANTDKLSQPFPLGDGDLLASPVGQLLYRTLLNPRLPAIDYGLPAAALVKQVRGRSKSGDPDFYNRELITRAILANLNRNPARAKVLYQTYGALNFTPPAAPARAALARIGQVTSNQDVTKAFTLPAATKVRIVGVGENCSADFKEWCDYGWIEQNGKVVWEMQGKRAASAGGATKNQRVEEVIELPAGTYQLRYKSDYAHAYDHWDSFPPANFTYGIELYATE